MSFEFLNKLTVKKDNFVGNIFIIHRIKLIADMNKI